MAELLVFVSECKFHESCCKIVTNFVDKYFAICESVSSGYCFLVAPDILVVMLHTSGYLLSLHDCAACDIDTVLHALIYCYDCIQPFLTPLYS